MATNTRKNKSISFADIAFEFFTYVGLFGIEAFKVWKTILSNFYNRRLKKHTKKIDNFFMNIVKKISSVNKSITYKIYMFFKFFVDAYVVVKNGYNRYPKKFFVTRIFYAVGAFCKGVRNNLFIFTTIFNHVFPAVAFYYFVLVVMHVSSLNFAVSVEYNGQHVGYIQDESVFERAEKELQQRMIYTNEEEIIDSIPKFTVQIVDDTILKTDLEMTDTIISSSAGEILQAVSLTIDGKFYGAVENSARIEATLQSLLDEHSTGDSGEEVSFLRDIKLTPGIFKTDNIVSSTSLINTITALEEKDVFYEIVSGDTPIIIAAKNDMSLDDVVALNPDILKSCIVGNQVQVKKAQAFLPVKVTRSEVYTEETPYEVTYSNTSSLYTGQTRTVSNGSNGEAVITAEVEYVDGVEISRTVVDIKTISEPVDQVIEKGTMAVPTATNTYKASVSNLGFQWPVTGGYVSQGFKAVSHRAFDYAYRGNGYGQPIYASLPGTVTYSGYRGSYGNLVIISSPGGIETYYAHCSSLLVSVGQTVAQGQQIAKVGSTGNSTGNHLHFEVRVNGYAQNPFDYLP